MKRAAIFASIALLAAVAAARAQSEAPRIPPEGSHKASEIVAAIEQRPDFLYLESMSWHEQGYYLLTYHTSDKAEVEIKIDAATGQAID